MEGRKGRVGGGGGEGEGGLSSGINYPKRRKFYQSG